MYKKINMKYIYLGYLIISSPLLALDFKVHGNNSKTLNAIMASGTIQYNDVEKLDQYIEKLPHKKHTAIYFDSPGGSLYGGIRLGKYFRQHRIKTVIQKNAICASACALAFLGGTDYRGNKWMSSTTESRLGFHAFSNADGTLYAHIGKTQKTASDILEYAEYVNAPIKIIRKSFATPSDDMYWFSTREALNLGIKVWSIKNERFIEPEYMSYKTNNYPPLQQSPSDFIKKYFTDLKHVPYRQTWNMLSNSMKKIVNLKNYTKWWDQQVDKVNIESIKESGTNIVKVRLKYYMKNGKITCTNDTFILRKNGNSWLIDKQRYKKCK